MKERSRRSDYRAHNELVTASLERQRQRKLLREWVNRQQNPLSSRRRQNFIAAMWASWDVDMRIGLASFAALLAFSGILYFWG
jgi:hypothetical protein